MSDDWKGDPSSGFYIPTTAIRESLWTVADAAKVFLTISAARAKKKPGLTKRQEAESLLALGKALDVLTAACDKAREARKT